MLTERVDQLERPVVRRRSPEKMAPQSNSVRRALAILEFLKGSERRRNLSEISRRLDLPKSTTNMLLSTLESMGYITRDPEERRYWLSSKAFGFGLELLNQLDLSRRSGPVLQTIATSLRVTALVAVLDLDQALFVNKADGCPAALLRCLSGASEPGGSGGKVPRGVFKTSFKNCSTG